MGFDDDINNLMRTSSQPPRKRRKKGNLTSTSNKLLYGTQLKVSKRIELNDNDISFIKLHKLAPLSIPLSIPLSTQLEEELKEKSITEQEEKEEKEVRIEECTSFTTHSDNSS